LKSHESAPVYFAQLTPSDSTAHDAAPAHEGVQADRDDDESSKSLPTISRRHDQPVVSAEAVGFFERDIDDFN
jgi:hypothetical protein